MKPFSRKFSLLALFAIIGIIAVAVSDYSNAYRRSRNSLAQVKTLSQYAGVRYNSESARMTLFPFLEIGSLPVVTSLSIEGGVPPSVFKSSLSHMPSLTSLSLSSTAEDNANHSEYSDGHLKAVEQLTNLRELELFNAAISDEGFRSFCRSGNDNITYLEFDACNTLSERGLERLDRFSSLQTLVFVNMEFSNSALHHMEGLPDLEHVYIDGCDNISDTEIENFSKTYNGRIEIVCLDH